MVLTCMTANTPCGNPIQHELIQFIANISIFMTPNHTNRAQLFIYKYYPP